MNEKVKKERKWNWNDFAILIILVVLIVIMAIINPVFLTLNNIMNIARQVSIVAIAGIGMTYVLISAEIDLSVGSLVGLTGVIAAMAMKEGMPIAVACLLAIAVSVFCGFMNGVIHTYVKIPSFIVTMGMMNIARGAVLVLTNSYPVTGLPEEFKMLGRGYMLGIPIPVVLMFACYIIGYFVLKYMRFGRSIYAIGGNIEAARLSGISVSKNKVLIHTICGLTAGIAGVVLAARLFSGQPSAGNGMELDAIAAAVIGGTSTAGGKGRLWGTLLGALILGIITNGMNLMNISTNWQYIMQGAIIIVAVGLDRIKNND